MNVAYNVIRQNCNYIINEAVNSYDQGVTNPGMVAREIFDKLLSKADIRNITFILNGVTYDYNTIQNIVKSTYKECEKIDNIKPFYYNRYINTYNVLR